MSFCQNVRGLKYIDSEDDISSPLPLRSDCSQVKKSKQWMQNQRIDPCWWNKYIKQYLFLLLINENHLSSNKECNYINIGCVYKVKRLLVKDMWTLSEFIQAICILRDKLQNVEYLSTILCKNECQIKGMWAKYYLACGW